MSKPYAIRIFVPDGDPEVKIIEQLNWTGKGLAFPRHKLDLIRSRHELSGTGVYILAGYAEEVDDLPKIYVGQGDVVRDRLDMHAKEKAFWNQAIVFVSNSLNKAHSGWLEHALWRRADEAKRCVLDNAQQPQQPKLGEAEQADTSSFLDEMLRILPLVGIYAFEISNAPIQTAKSVTIVKPTISAGGIDTVIVPAYDEGFKKVFLGQDCWYEIRISAEKLNKIKYIAAYQTYPVCAITHYAAVDHIEPYGSEGKYKLAFSGKAKQLPNQVVFGDAAQGSMQGTRYTTLQTLLSAKKITDIGIGKAVSAVG